MRGWNYAVYGFRASILDDMLDGGGSGRLNNISNNYTVVGYGASIFDDMLDG